MDEIPRPRDWPEQRPHIFGEPELTRTRVRHKARTGLTLAKVADECRDNAPDDDEPVLLPEAA